MPISVNLGQVYMTLSLYMSQTTVQGSRKWAYIFNCHLFGFVSALVNVGKELLEYYNCFVVGDDCVNPI